MENVRSELGNIEVETYVVDEDWISSDQGNHFTDCRRKIDLVIGWESSENNHDSKIIEQFIDKIHEAGFDTEISPSSSSALMFLKLHVPQKLLDIHAHNLGIKPPVKVCRILNLVF